MNDSSWIRAYGNKNIYTPGEIRSHRFGIEGAGEIGYITKDSGGIVFCDAGSTHGNRCARWDGDGNLDSWSDFRLKKTGIEEEPNLLKRIMKIPVKNFYWKDLLEAEYKEVGFIAQDVEPYFPHLVSEIENPSTNVTYKALAHSDFGILAFGGVRELKIEKDAEITALKKENEDLKAQLNDLMKRIEVLENQ